jgi:hypothetical protein
MVAVVAGIVQRALSTEDAAVTWAQDQHSLGRGRDGMFSADDDRRGEDKERIIMCRRRERRLGGVGVGVEGNCQRQIEEQ